MPPAALISSLIFLWSLTTPVTFEAALNEPMMRRAALSFRMRSSASRSISPLRDDGAGATIGVGVGVGFEYLRYLALYGLVGKPRSREIKIVHARF